MANIQFTAKRNDNVLSIKDFPDGQNFVSDASTVKRCDIQVNEPLFTCWGFSFVFKVAYIGFLISSFVTFLGFVGLCIALW